MERPDARSAEKHDQDRGTQAHKKAAMIQAWEREWEREWNNKIEAWEREWDRLQRWREWQREHHLRWLMAEEEELLKRHNRWHLSDCSDCSDASNAFTFRPATRKLQRPAEEYE
jgi:hypothetical protein